MRVFGAIVLALLGSACVRDGTKNAGGRPEAGSAIGTVVLVTIDTWRWDANGFLGGRQPSPTPFLDRLAEGALVLEGAVSPVPLTGPAHWSMLSGRWPWRDGVRVNGDRPAESTPATLPELLRERGWHTGGFVSCAVLARGLGFARGFEQFDDDVPRSGRATDLRLPERPGEETVAAALEWLARQRPQEPVFLWVHLFEPHFPHPASPGRFAGEHGAYLADVALADRLVERLWRGVEGLERTRRHLWIVLADHGEGLGEHGEETHGTLLHGATTRIPMLLVGDGVEPGRRGDVISTVDLLPTVAAALGVDLEPRDGADLLAGVARDRSVPLESLYGLRAHGLSPVIGLRTGQWLWERSPEDHLWDLRSDPGELTDLALRNREVVERLSELRAAYGQPSAAQRVRSAEVEAQLRELGYASSGTHAGAGDARRFVADGEALMVRLLSLQRQGDLERAEVAASEFLKRYPGSVTGWLEAGFVAVGRADLAAAEERFERGLALDPENPQLRLNLGNVLLITGRAAAAEAAYRAVLEQNEQEPMALYNLGLALERQGRSDAAAGVWRRFLARYPKHPAAASLGARLGNSAARPKRGVG